MRESAKQVTSGAAAVVLVLLLVFAITLWSGAYSFAADNPDPPAVTALIKYARERSVHVRADDVKVPPLDGQAMIVKGAAHYQKMCAKCHGAPGAQPTELSQDLYPSPPDLPKHPVEPAGAFWTIKHGIKASAMPAWGKSMSDADIWNLVAFLQKLPSMDQAGYHNLVDESGGQGPGEGAGTGPHENRAVDDAAHGEQGGDGPQHPR